MKTIKMMVGVSGSGKSTYCKGQSETVFSTDEIRIELFGPDLGKAQSPENNELVYATLHSRILSYEGDAIYDATNLEIQRRADFKKKFDGHLHIVCVIEPIIVPLATNLRRNSYRKVPLNVVQNMYANMDVPVVGVDCDSYEVVGSPFFKRTVWMEDVEAIADIGSVIDLMTQEYIFETKHVLALDNRPRFQNESAEDYLSYVFRQMGRAFHPRGDYRKIGKVYALKALSEIKGIKNKERIINEVVQ